MLGERFKSIRPRIPSWRFRRRIHFRQADI